MLQDIRDNSQGTIAKVIIGLICATFALVGVESILGGGGQTKAAEVNGQVISNQELEDSVRLRQRSLMAQMGGRIDPQMLDANKLAPQVLQSLVNRYVSIQLAEDLGFEVSKQQMNLSISESPQFQQDGKFSQELFDAFTQSLSISSSSFSDIYHSELIINQASSGIINSAFMSDAAIDIDTIFTHQTRDIRFIELTIEKALAEVTASDSEVVAYYEANSKNFMSSEKVKLEYIELKLADFVKPPSDAEIQAAYDAEIANISMEPSIQVAHILVDPAMHDGREGADALIKTVIAKLDAGESFSDLAKRYSDDFGSKEMGGALGQLSADVFPFEFVEAASSLEVGDVSAVVETENGLHLISVTAKTLPEIPSFESRQEALSIALSESNASPAFWAAVEELRDISFNAPDLTEPAELLEVKVQTSALFDRTTNDELMSNPVLLGQAFNSELINEGVNSELIELSSEHAVVLRIVEHKPEALKAFSDVKAQANQELLVSLAESLLVKQSAEINTLLLDGDSIESIAKSLKLDWQAELSVNRGDNKLPPSVSKAAFSAGALEKGQSLFDSVSLSRGGVAVFSVSNVQDGKPTSIQAAEKTMMQTYLAQNKGALEYQALTYAAKSEANIELYR